MPCWEVNTYTLAFKATNVKLIMEVLNDMRLNPRYDETYNEIDTSIGTFNLNTGKVDVNERGNRKINSFRKRYSKKVMEVAAKKFKWNIKRKKVGSKVVYNVVKWQVDMKIIELTCNNSGNHNAGMLLTKKERAVIFSAVEEYSNNHKRKTTAKKLFNYMYKHLPV